MVAPVKPLLAASLLLSASACAPELAGPEQAVPSTAAWRTVATEADRGNIRNWRKAWVEALEKARAGGHGEAIVAEGVLLQPDAALVGVAPPAGDYRCRVVKIGAKGAGNLDYVAYPAFSCRIGAGEGDRDFAKLTGSQRPIGRLFPENDSRMIFLGTLQLGDEQGTLRYGHDPERAMAGILERVGERRWRLVFPYPQFESIMDVLELVPQD
jgi:hypothetical protein